MMKVVLLGSNGQLGTALKQTLKDPKITLMPLTRADIDADHDHPPDKLQPYADYDYLINCIAYHKVDQCEKNVDQSFAINGRLVLQLARFCAENDLTMIHISTDYVFDGRRRAAYTEDDLPSPLNVYGTSKLAGEAFVRAYAPRHFVLRVSSLFGQSADTGPGVNFVEKMVQAAREQQPLNVIDNQIMSPTYTVDAAMAIRGLIESGETAYGLYHGCNSGECSWFEFAQKIFDLTGLKADLTPASYDEFHTGATRPQFCSMDNTKLQRFVSMRPWPEALEEYLARKGYK